MEDITIERGVRVCRDCGGRIRGLMCHQCGAIGDPKVGYEIFNRALKGRNDEDTATDIQQPE